MAAAPGHHLCQEGATWAGEPRCSHQERCTLGWGEGQAAPQHKQLPLHPPTQNPVYLTSKSSAKLPACSVCSLSSKSILNPQISTIHCSVCNKKQTNDNNFAEVLPV